MIAEIFQINGRTRIMFCISKITAFDKMVKDLKSMDEGQYASIIIAKWIVDRITSMTITIAMWGLAFPALEFHRSVLRFINFGSVTFDAIFTIVYTTAIVALLYGLYRTAKYYSTIKKKGERLSCYNNSTWIYWDSDSDSD